MRSEGFQRTEVRVGILLTFVNGMHYLDQTSSGVGRTFRSIVSIRADTKEI